MRKSTVWFGAGALFFLAACSPADPVEADRVACTQLLSGDSEIEEDLADFSSDVASYCDCYARTMVTEPEGTQEDVRKIVEAISSIRSADGVSLEAAAERVEEFAEGRVESSTYDLTAAEFDAAGRIIEGVRRSMRSNDGQCPAPEA